MDEADEFFDCDNDDDDYGSQVNDALLDSLSAGLAGFSLATPKHRSTHPNVTAPSSSQPLSPSRRSQGSSPLKPILNNRDNILANLSTSRQRDSPTAKKGSVVGGDENATFESPSKSSRSPLKSKGRPSLLRSAVDDDESVFVDACSRSQSPTPFDGNATFDKGNATFNEGNATFDKGNATFSKFCDLEVSVAQDSFLIDEFEEAVFLRNDQRAEKSQSESSERRDAASADTTLVAPATPVSPGSDDCSRVVEEVPPAMKNEVAVERNDTLPAAASREPSTTSADASNQPRTEKSFHGVGEVPPKTPLDGVGDLAGFHCSPELMAMKMLLSELDVKESPSKAPKIVEESTTEEVVGAVNQPIDIAIAPVEAINVQLEEDSKPGNSTEQECLVTASGDEERDLPKHFGETKFDPNSTFDRDPFHSEVGVRNGPPLKLEDASNAEIEGGPSTSSGDGDDLKPTPLEHPDSADIVGASEEASTVEECILKSTAPDSTFTFDDTANPFASRGGIQNSPRRVDGTGIDEVAFDDEVDPFMSRGGIQNSPAKAVVDDSQQSSSVATENVEPPVAKTCDANVEDTQTIVDAALQPSEEEVENMDPFASKGGLVNSPDMAKSNKQVVHTQKVDLNGTLDRPAEVLEVVQEEPTFTDIHPPSTTSTEKVNPSIATKCDASPVKANVDAINQPSLNEAENVDTADDDIIVPSKGYSFNGDVDPFASKGGLVNSPGIAKSSKQVVHTQVDLNGTFDRPAEVLEAAQEEPAFTDIHPPSSTSTEKVNPSIATKCDASPVKASVDAINQPRLKEAENVDTADDDIIVPSMGYSFDGGVDPFASKGGLVNSPDVAKSNKQVVHSQVDLNGTFDRPAEVLEAVQEEPAFTDIHPLSTSTEKAYPSIAAKCDASPLKASVNAINQPRLKEPENVDTADDIIIPSKGYSFDGGVDPFASKGGLVNSPDVAKSNKRVVRTQKVDLNGTFDRPAEVLEVEPEEPAFTDIHPPSTTSTETANPLIAGKCDAARVKAIATSIDASKTSKEAEDMEKADDEIVVPHVGYSFDDSVDPFAPKGGLLNSPDELKSKKQPVGAIKVDLNGTFDKPIETFEAGREPSGEVVDGLERSSSTLTKGLNLPAAKKSHVATEEVKSIPDFSDPSSKEDEKMEAEDEMIVPSKAYSIDDNLDPFASKGGLPNSPRDEIVVPNKSYSCDDNKDPFATKGGLLNSPDLVKSKMKATRAKKADLDGTFDEPSGKPEVVDEKPLNSNLNCTFDLQMETNQDAIAKEPSEGNPFVSRGGIPNSPVGRSDVTTFPATPEIPRADKRADDGNVSFKGVAEEKMEEDGDAADDDFVIPRGCYTFDENIDPFASKGGIGNSPTKAMLTNGPKEKTKVEDPFAVEAKVANSPKVETGKGVVSTSGGAKSKTDTPVTDDAKNPFATKSKMVNTPKAKASIKSDASVAASEIVAEPKEADPFVAKCKMAESPKSNPPAIIEEENPFATKSKMVNGPKSTPATMDEENPFVTKSKMANSPKSKLAAVEEENPFVTKSKMVSSPISKKTENVTSEPTAVDHDDIDPFISKGGIQNSPVKAQSPPKKEAREKEENKENEEKKEEKKEGKKGATGKGKSRPKSKMREMMEMKRKEMQRRNGMEDIVEDTVVETTPQQAQEAPIDDVAPITSKEAEEAAENDFGFSDADFRPSEDFLRDPSAFDVLANIGADKRFSVSQSRLARDSLYVKFDPLMSSGSSQSSSTALSPAAAVADMPPPAAIPREKADSSPTRDDDSPRESMILIGTPPAKHKDQSVKLSARKDNNLARVRETDTPDAKSGVDLLSGSPVRAGAASSKVARNLAKNVEEEQKTPDLKVRDLELDFQSRMLQKEKEFADEKKKMQQREAKLKAEISKRNKENAALTQDMAGMKSIVEGFEGTIQELMSGQEELNKEKEREVEAMKKEKEAAAEETASVEKAFSDLHKRFDKARELIEGFKKNEQVLKNYAEESRVKLEKQMEKYSTLKKHAEEKIELANKTIGDERKAAEAEQTKLKASLKLVEIKLGKLQKQVEDKTKENEELTNICDELLSKVGQS